MGLYNQRITELAEQLHRNTNQTSRAVRAKNFIDEYFENVLTIDTIAYAVQVSKSQLKSEFKRQYGVTFSQYLKDKRISEAKQLINNEDILREDLQFRLKKKSGNGFK